MKKLQLLLLGLFCHFACPALNVTVIESQSMVTGHDMDTEWYNVLLSMGHTPVISPQTTLDNTTFFANTDILIISSGVISLPANRVTTILQFLQTGKPVYLQSEYLTSYTTNQAFSSIVASLGGTFTWGNTVSGDLQPTTVLGTYATTNLPVSSLSYFWYGVNGTGDCNTTSILQYGTDHLGWQYVPGNPSFGTIITTTDQDWVRATTSPALMQNIITHLINPPPSSSNAVNVNLGNDTTLCQGGTLTLNASAGNSSYLWQDNSTGPTFTVSTSGTYWVTVSGSCGSGQDTITVNFNPAPQVNIGSDTTLCLGDTILLDATTTNAAYVWQNGSTNPTYTVSSQGLYWVEVTSNGCSNRDSINVTYNTSPQVSFGNDTTLCQGDILTLNAAVPGGSYTWQDGSTASFYNVSGTGAYWVQANNNCGTASDTINVSFTPLPIVDLGTDTILCAGDVLTLDATTANASYTWQDNSTSSAYTVTSQGTYWVQVLHACATVSDTIHITYNSSPVVSLGNDTILCEGAVLLLDATNSNASYLWSNGSTGSTINVSTGGTYWVQATNSCGGRQDTITVSYISLPLVNIGNDTTLCDGSILILDATTPSSTYTWSDNTTNPLYTVSSQGTYWVQVAHTCGLVSDTIQVSYNPVPTVYLGNDTSMCPGEPLVLDATTSNASYLWQDNSSGAVYTSSNPGTYWVEVTVNGCSGKDSLTVMEKYCESIVIMPNVFTPNSDGHNDLFIPVTMDGVVSMSISIYNRWGNAVFTTSNPAIEWDGSSYPDGVYYWVLNYVDANGDNLAKTGWVQLLR